MNTTKNTNNFPKVTVVTVTHNAEKYLERTIKSVIEQDYSNIEYIIIDGASSDRTVDIIKKYEEYISYWISEPDEGIYYAMNKAIDIATSEWINFINAGDSFVSKKTISYVVNNLEQNICLITGDRYSIYENSSKKILNKAQGIVGIKEYGMPSGHQSMFINTYLMKQYKYSLDYKYAADHDLMLRFYKDNQKIKVLNYPISNYLRGGYSDENNEEVYIEILFLMLKYKPHNNHSIKNLSLFKDFFYYHHPNETQKGTNLLFSKQLNTIINQYIDFINKYNNIMIYGNGTVSKMLLNINTKNIIGIADQINLTKNALNIPVYHCDTIPKIKFKKIIISVLGREDEISKFLQNKLHINRSDILIFDMTTIY